MEDYEPYVKSQVSADDWKVIEALGLNLDRYIPVDLWSDFVNFQKRKQKEAPFLLEQLAEYSDPKVFDACLGSGATTIGLRLAGVEKIVSNEISDDLIETAVKEARRFGVGLNITAYDWRELNKQYNEEFDAVLCLGNSLTYLFKKEDQLKGLENFRSILKPKGKLIIDERNYSEHFLNGTFRFSGEVLYCGKDKVDAHPIYVSDTMVVMEYQHRETRQKAHLVLYPFKKNELRELLQQVGFRNITAFGDYEKDFKPEEPEFITYVGER